MSYKVLVIGDIHFGKSFKSYKRNPYSKHDGLNLTEVWRTHTLSYLIDVVNEIKNQNVDEVIFLGDIVDKPRTEPIDANFAKVAIETFSEIVSKTSIIVGNHDTVEPQNPHGSILSLFEPFGSVYSSYFIDKAKKFIYLPYYKKDILKDVLIEISQKLKSENESPFNYTIFSHNDIYVNSSLINTEMISEGELRKIFDGEEIGIVNGHIHNYYAEPSQKIVFTGSVSPTSFKDDPLATGVCLIEINRNDYSFKSFKRFRNNNLVFITIDSESVIPKLESYLVKIRPYSPVVVLRFPANISKQIEPTLEKFSDLIHFYKIKTKSEEIEPQFSKFTTTPNISNEKIDKSIFSKVREKIEKGLTIEEVSELFDKYLKMKYPDVYTG
jgi:predicted phosphodiesterase